jgi:hypothetical protein
LNKINPKTTRALAEPYDFSWFPTPHSERAERGTFNVLRGQIRAGSPIFGATVTDEELLSQLGNRRRTRIRRPKSFPLSAVLFRVYQMKEKIPIPVIGNMD